MGAGGDVSWRREAVDGAVVTVDRESDISFAVNCTVCGYVTSDTEERHVEEIAEHHEGWHEAEHQREQSYR